MANLKIDYSKLDGDSFVHIYPSPTFKTIDDASDWALGVLPYGTYIYIRDGRGTLRAHGFNSCKLKIEKRKKK